MVTIFTSALPFVVIWAPFWILMLEGSYVELSKVINDFLKLKPIYLDTNIITIGLVMPAHVKKHTFGVILGAILNFGIDGGHF